MRNKVWVALLLMMILALPAFSMGQQEKGAVSEQAPVNTVTDDLGREIVIPENAKILCLTSAAMTAVYNLGLEPIGKVEEYKVTKKGMALPSVGKAQSVNIEAIYSLAPDLIFASSRFHAALEEELEGCGAVIFYFDPDKAGAIPVVELTDHLGDALGMPEKGEAYVQQVFDQGVQFGKQIKAKYPELETGVMFMLGSGVKSAQSKSSFGSMLSLLGIKNIVPANLPNAKKSSFLAYDVEKIVKDNPDVVFILAQSKDPAANKKLLQSFKKDEKWADLDAVKNNMVFILPFKANPNRSAPDQMLKLTAQTLLKAGK